MGAFAEFSMAVSSHLAAVKVRRLSEAILHESDCLSTQDVGLTPEIFRTVISDLSMQMCVLCVYPDQ
jgi:hypothetical protein